MHERVKLVRVHVDLPHHWATSGESMWARALGNDLYELDNVPFGAYGLNYGDVVFATPDGPGLAPEIRSVVELSGHRTLRVFFSDSVRQRRRFRLRRN